MDERNQTPVAPHLVARTVKHVYLGVGHHEVASFE
jgi:hypothetical protein